MSTPLNLKIDQERALEIPMVDLAFLVLKAANTPYYYRDLMKEVAKLRGMSEEQSREAIAELYTEINIDGRFACVGANLWGLKRWYPIERSEDPVSSAKRPRIINDDDIEDDDFSDDVEKKFTADNDGFDSVDDEDDQDELFTDEDESIEDVEDDSLIDEEEIEEDLGDDELSEDEEEQEEEDEDYEDEDFGK
ncbi:putative DNA-directed RNA polymerase subunit delta [compost metagenome]